MVVHDITRRSFLSKNIHFYYIKVSGIPSGNKLIKTMRYPHMWRYRCFRWYHVCLLNCTWIRWCIIETSSGLPRKSSAIFGNLRTSSGIFGNSRKMFGNVRLAFGTILENLQKSSESGQKSSENHKKRRHQYERTLHVSSKIWTLCSRGKNNIPLIRCAHSWDIIVLATRT